MEVNTVMVEALRLAREQAKTRARDAGAKVSLVEARVWHALAYDMVAAAPQHWEQLAKLSLARSAR